MVRVVCVAFALAIVLARLLAMYDLSINCVMKDQWRFLPLVELYYDGDLSFSHLTQFSSHIKVGYLAMFLGNAVLLDLNMKAELAFAILLFLPSLILIYCGLKRSGIDEGSIFFMIIFVAITLILMSEAKHAYFRYSLITMGHSVGLLCFLAMWTIADIYRRRTQSNYILLTAAAIIMILVVVGFGGGRVPGFIVATLLSLLLPYMFQPEQRKRIFEFIGIFLLFGIVLQVWYWSAVRTGVPGVSQGVGAIANDMQGAFSFAFRALSASVLHATELNKLSMNQQLLLGGTIALLYSVSAFLYMKYRYYEHTIIPLAMMLYTVCYLGLLVIARFGLGFDNATAPRYAGETMVGHIGVVWIFGMALSRMYHRRVGIVILAVIFLVVATTEATHCFTAKRCDGFRKVQLERQLVLLKNREYDQLARWFRTAGNSTVPVIEGDRILRKYKLGPYAGND